MFHWAAFFSMFVCAIIFFINLFLGGSGGQHAAEASERAMFKYGLIGVICAIVFILT